MIAAGDAWTDEYLVRPIGVLESPSVLTETVEVLPEEGKVSGEWVVVGRK